MTNVRNYMQRSEIANAVSGERIFWVEWSPADNEFVGLVAEFPSLSWLAPTEDEALRGIVRLSSSRSLLMMSMTPAMMHDY